MHTNWTIDGFVFYSGSVFCFVCKDRAARQRNMLGLPPPTCLGERCSSGRKLCHLLTSFFSPLSTNRILQRKGERGTARERQRGRRARRRMRGVFVLPCCEPESDLSSKIKTCRVQHLLDPLTRKHTYFLAFTRSTNISSVSVPSMKSRRFLLHPPSPSDLCPFPSITPSRTLNTTPIHHSFLSSPSTHPFFCLHLSLHPSAGTVEGF